MKTQLLRMLMHGVALHFDVNNVFVGSHGIPVLMHTSSFNQIQCEA